MNDKIIQIISHDCVMYGLDSKGQLWRLVYVAVPGGSAKPVWEFYLGH